MSRKQHPVREGFRELAEAFRLHLHDAHVFTLDRNVPVGTLPKIVINLENLYSSTRIAVRHQHLKVETALEEMHAGILEESLGKAKPEQSKAERKVDKAMKRAALANKLIAKFDKHLAQFTASNVEQDWLNESLLRDWFIAEVTASPRKFMRKQLIISKVSEFTFTDFICEARTWMNNAVQARDIAIQFGAQLGGEGLGNFANDTEKLLCSRFDSLIESWLSAGQLKKGEARVLADWFAEGVTGNADEFMVGKLEIASPASLDSDYFFEHLDWMLEQARAKPVADAEQAYSTNEAKNGFYAVKSLDEV